MPTNFYHTQKVRGFQQQKVKYSKENVEIRLKRTKQQCPSTTVSVKPICRRQIRGEPLGSCRKVVLEFTVHRLYCPVAITVQWNIFCFSPTPKPA